MLPTCRASFAARLEFPLLDDRLVHMYLANILGKDVHERLVNVLDNTVIVGADMQIYIRNIR